MSCPAQKASPAPVSTRTWVCGSTASSANASSMSRCSCGLMALRLSGRFMISQVMPCCFSIRTVSYFFVIIVFSSTRVQSRYSGSRERARGGAACHRVKYGCDHRHQHGPYQPQRRKLGALAVGPKVDQGDRHGLRAWSREQNCERQYARCHQKDEQPAREQGRREQRRNDAAQPGKGGCAAHLGGFFELAVDLQHARGAVAHAIGQVVDDKRPDQDPERAVERDRQMQKKLHDRDAEDEAGKDQRNGGEPLDRPAARRTASHAAAKVSATAMVAVATATKRVLAISSK